MKHMTHSIYTKWNIILYSNTWLHDWCSRNPIANKTISFILTCRGVFSAVIVLLWCWYVLLFLWPFQSHHFGNRLVVVHIENHNIVSSWWISLEIMFGHKEVELAIVRCICRSEWVMLTWIVWIKDSTIILIE